MTSDLEKAKGFYGELFGWKFEEMPMPSGSYTMIKAGERFVGGMMAKPPNMAEIPSHWVTYISVSDVDAAVAGATKLGGKAVFGPETMPGVGRMATVVDPNGAVLAVMRGEKGDGPLPERPSLGEFCWETLTTPDGTKSKAFYAALCGWKTVKGPVSDEMIVFGTDSGEQVADVQETKDVPPSWLTYVVVEKRDAARARAEKLGAKVLMPSIEVPNVGSIAVVADPNGAVLGLFQPNMG